MAKAPSSMMPLGTQAPLFSLLDTISGKTFSLHATTTAKATVIMFICNHCPYVKHINKELTRLSKEYMMQGIQFLAINSNDVTNYPDDSPENMKKIAHSEAYPFPYLFDETQEVAKAYHAACTPDFFIYDAKLTLVYRGQFDNSRPGNQIEVTGNSLREALDCILANQAVSAVQHPSLGCNIKWKP